MIMYYKGAKNSISFFTFNVYFSIYSQFIITKFINFYKLLNITSMSTAQKIAEIEAEIDRTQKNKATSYHVGLLKAKLAKLKR